MKLRQIVAMISVASGASLFATAVYAQPSEQPFHSLDKNGDGYLTNNEVSHLRGFSKAFKEADDNHDGRLSQDEFIKAQSIYDFERLGGYLRDSELTAKVKTALLREMKSTQVHVETDRGRVLLSGWVASPTQREKAIQIASSVQGVRQVRNGMTVR
jgi:hyperosmotically inducible periplasmic protein